MKLIGRCVICQKHVFQTLPQRAVRLPPPNKPRVMHTRCAPKLA